MSKALQGVRVLDLTRLLPGGVCTMMLADMGADVVKIEDPSGGDYARWMPPDIDGQGVFFRMNNRDKRSVIIDLKQSDGAAVLKKLVEKADVLVEGFRPDVMARLGCDYATLKNINPRLVYCAISGWGATGPYAERSGHDLNYVSTAGLTGAMANPAVFGGQVGDIGGAYMAVNGILAALLRRERTGEGGFVDVSLFESSLPFGLYAWVEAVMNGTGGGQGTLTGGLACYNIYRARDGKQVSLAALEPKFWTNFCNAIQRPDLIADYMQPERQKYLKAEVEQTFYLHPASHWEAVLQHEDCCFALVNAPGEVADDPQIQARGMMGVDAKGSPWMRTPLILDNESFTPGHVPGYGEHTQAALLEAGYSQDEITNLAGRGIIKQM